jgi:LmbE family N-acetylglucosaminyl deacetylase
MLENDKFLYMKKTVLGIFAHPDDAEMVCAGTLSLLGKTGWEVHIASFTPGDKGTAEYGREEISLIRKEEARIAASLIGATYHCLDFEDLYILYERETINRTAALIRQIQPSLVFTSPPSDYMVDHEMVSKIVQTACFATGIKNMDIKEVPYGPVPYLYYCDPIEGKDKFGVRTQPTIYIDITSEIEIKKRMLSGHKSQRDWLKRHHKMDEYIVSMERFAMMRGSEINTDYAESFVQHLGHGFPQNNILKEVIPEFLIDHI